MASKPDQNFDTIVELFGRHAISKYFFKIAPKLHQSRNLKIKDDSLLPNLVEKLHSKFKAEILKNVGCGNLLVTAI